MATAAPRTFYRILRLHQLVTTVLDETLEPLSLTSRQYTVLSMIRRTAPVTSAELARRLDISAQSMGESHGMLERKGLISRSPSPANKRQILLVLTPEGKKLLQKADRVVERAEREFLKSLAPGRLEQFEATIAQLRAAHGVAIPSGPSTDAESAA